MQSRCGILLTGATGLLGRYLLRDLLLSGRHVAALARDSREAPAAQRLAELVAFWSEALGRKLPAPVVLDGDLRLPGLGLGPADRRRLTRECGAVVHAAANISFQPSTDGEPWTTNADGTQHLLDLCRALGMAELHHVSTAFVCGDRTGTVYEDELDRGQGFHNAYEESKFEAERRVRQAAGLHATVYRPAVIVGDSRTGYTCTYHGIYRFLHLAARLAEAARPAPTVASGNTARERRLPLRLPFTGEEPRNLVPVDWVAQAILHVFQRPARHGGTYHLVAARPVRSQEIKEAAERALRLEGVSWAGPGELADPTPLERLFLDSLRDYWPYFQGDPVFDCRQSSPALADLPAPRVDAALLARLIQFAEADQWGRAPTPCPSEPAPELDCAHYMENFFPAEAPRSPLARAAALDLTIALDIHGQGGGQWSCRWTRGELAGVCRGLDARAEVTYRTDVATFAAVVAGRQTPQEAFFARRIDIAGDVEKGLKLTVLLQQFLKDFPYNLSRNGDGTPKITGPVPVSR
jgi:nucleoside-diphosphate-sugar epimerase